MPLLWISGERIQCYVIYMQLNINIHMITHSFSSLGAFMPR